MDKGDHRVEPDFITSFLSSVNVGILVTAGTIGTFLGVGGETSCFWGENTASTVWPKVKLSLGITWIWNVVRLRLWDECGACLDYP